MQMQSNTILITGGSSGIGRGLAEALHKLDNQVIITGRREDRLREICEQNPGMRYYLLDVRDAAAVRTVAQAILTDFPSLNCLFNNAGVQHQVAIGPAAPLDDDALQDEVDTNLLGVIRVTAALLPYLADRPHAILVNVSSGLAFVPMARFAVYCATKAAVHSFTLSLRHQLKSSRVKVLELIPPYVATELGGAGKTVRAAGPQPMPLDAFIAETMKALESGEEELAIGDAKYLTSAVNADTLKGIFARMNR